MPNDFIQSVPDSLGREAIKKCVSILSEHYDAVEILVTRCNEDKTTDVFSMGTGNVYARYGLAKEYVERSEESIRIEKRRQENDKPF